MTILSKPFAHPKGVGIAYAHQQPIVAERAICVVDPIPLESTKMTEINIIPCHDFTVDVPVRIDLQQRPRMIKDRGR